MFTRQRLSKTIPVLPSWQSPPRKLFVAYTYIYIYIYIHYKHNIVPFWGPISILGLEIDNWSVQLPEHPECHIVRPYCHPQINPFALFALESKHSILYTVDSEIPSTMSSALGEWGLAAISVVPEVESLQPLMPPNAGSFWRRKTGSVCHRLPLAWHDETGQRGLMLIRFGQIRTWMWSQPM